jgi:hypothetical protein
MRHPYVTFTPAGSDENIQSGTSQTPNGSGSTRYFKYKISGVRNTCFGERFVISKVLLLQEEDNKRHNNKNKV